MAVGCRVFLNVILQQQRQSFRIGRLARIAMQRLMSRNEDLDFDQSGHKHFRMKVNEKIVCAYKISFDAVRNLNVVADKVSYCGGENIF